MSATTLQAGESASPSAGRTRRPRLQPGERRAQILQTLAAMLEEPDTDRITTAALARRLQVSEAALYRHFASKAQMFEGLIEFIDSSLFTLINRITAEEASGAAQLENILRMLLTFAKKNPGMTRVVIGDALVTEDVRLTQQINRLLDRLELAIKQSVRTAVADQSLPVMDAGIVSSNIVAYVLGVWTRFAKSQFSADPLAGVEYFIAGLSVSAPKAGNPDPNVGRNSR